jgi:hypothetical protein
MKKTIFLVVFVVGLVSSDAAQSSKTTNINSNKSETSANVGLVDSCQDKLIYFVQSIFNDLNSAKKGYNGLKFHALQEIRGYANQHNIVINETKETEGISDEATSDDNLRHALNTILELKKFLGVEQLNHKLERLHDDITQALGIESSPTPSPNPQLLPINSTKIDIPSKQSESNNVLKAYQLVDSAYKILTSTKTDLGISRQTCSYLQKFSVEYGIKLTPSKSYINCGQNTASYRLNDALNKIDQANELCPNYNLKNASILLRTGLDVHVHHYYY